MYIKQFPCLNLVCEQLSLLIHKKSIIRPHGWIYNVHVHYQQIATNNNSLYIITHKDI